MKVYTYNPITGVYIGTSEADESQLEPGVYLMPAYSTEVEPPLFDSSTEIIYFDADSKVWNKQNIEAEQEVVKITQNDIDKLKNELSIMRSKRSQVLQKLGLTEKEIEFVLVTLPTEDLIDELLGKPVPENGIPSLLPPDFE